MEKAGQAFTESGKVGKQFTEDGKAGAGLRLPRHLQHISSAACAPCCLSCMQASFSSLIICYITGGTAQEVGEGTPLDKDGAVGKQFTTDGAVGERHSLLLVYVWATLFFCACSMHA